MPRPRRRGLQFVRVEVKPIPTSAPLELALRGERVARVPAGFDAAAFTRLLSILDESACRCCLWGSGSSRYADGIKFDGIAVGVLMDAKGPGYDNFVKNGRFQN